jgi:hypothetical protein
MAAAGILTSLFFAAIALYTPYLIYHSERVDGSLTKSIDGTVNELNETVVLFAGSGSPGYYTGNYSSFSPSSPSSSNSRVIVILLNYSSVLSNYERGNKTNSNSSSPMFSASNISSENQLFFYIMNSSLICSSGDTFSAYPDLIFINSSEVLPLLISFEPNDSIFFPVYLHYYNLEGVRYTFNQADQRIYVQLYLHFHINESQFHNYQVMIIVIPVKDSLGSTQNIVFVVLNHQEIE